jgi:hypothetical protein
MLLGAARWQPRHVGEMIQKRSTIIRMLITMMLLLVYVVLFISMHLRIRIATGGGTGIYAAVAAKGRHEGEYNNNYLVLRHRETVI